VNQDTICCVAVDDEPPALEVIEKYIGAIPRLHLVASCSNAVDTLTVLQQNKTDLLFLDIQMPYILGTDFMRTIPIPPKVIFTTAFRKYAVEGFDLNAVDYLLKPISFERFLKAVNKVMQYDITASNSVPGGAKQIPEQVEFIYVRADRKNLKIFLDEILFVESLKDYIKIVTKEKMIVTKQSLSSIEEALPAHLFIRIHRSFIVSLHKTDSFSREVLKVGKYELPISRSYRHEIEKILKQTG
jgi:DNA-binding LytR/AlgR family response regulator